MKIFHCDSCQNVVFFENLRCANCGYELAFVPALGSVTALEPAYEDLWQRASSKDATAESSPKLYRKCHNYNNQSICNWVVDADDLNPFCISCRLTQTIPALDQPGHADAWFRLESAKRRLIFSLLEMQLPVRSKVEDPVQGVIFDFLADDPSAAPAGSPALPVLTGHDDGKIVINIAEADDAERERRRVEMHEPYRTLLGHLRHEIGHFYWDRLVRDSDRLEAFRRQFGDERQDYAETLKAYYANGAPADWQQHFVTAYASAHPWEDWAETWAHYLHITDTLETADGCGLSLHPPRSDEPKLEVQPLLNNPCTQQFEQMIERWFPLSYLLNNLNRGLGLPDAYPFVLSPMAVEKLRFVHDTLCPQMRQQEPAKPESKSDHQAQTRTQSRTEIRPKTESNSPQAPPTLTVTEGKIAQNPSPSDVRKLAETASDDYIQIRRQN